MCFQWVNDKLKKLNCFDYGMIKVCVFAFALLVAKLWAPILSLEWYYYAAVFAGTWAFLFIRIFGK